MIFPRQLVVSVKHEESYEFPWKSILSFRIQISSFRIVCTLETNPLSWPLFEIDAVGVVPSNPRSTTMSISFLDVHLYCSAKVLPSSSPSRSPLNRGTCLQRRQWHFWLRQTL